MTYKTHIINGLLFGETVFVLYPHTQNVESFFLFFLFCMIGSLFPDIDESKSKISKSIPFFLTYFMNKFSHRGFTHNIFGLAFFNTLFFLSTEYIFGVNTATIASLGFFTGYISHIFGDMVTYSGLEFIPGFHRMKIGIFGSFKVGSTVELKIYNIYLVVQVFLFFVLFYRLYVIHGGQ